ncbi:MAG: hypothetical protein JKY37_32100 [Nannocystaceae bacterium]|nr:hypothetical protein [Nannocystaceae bacterium]
MSAPSRSFSGGLVSQKILVGLALVVLDLKEVEVVDQHLSVMSHEPLDKQRQGELAVVGRELAVESTTPHLEAGGLCVGGRGHAATGATSLEHGANFLRGQLAVVRIDSLVTEVITDLQRLHNVFPWGLS